ncbi:MAG: hypothetical protein HZB39_07555 [Planctomycetes bacterium]|nr:hypothetical protein [Planctomycetota bacterium]
MTRLADGLARTVLFGTTTFAVVVHALLQSRIAVPAWSLPAAFVIGAILAVVLPSPIGVPDEATPTPRRRLVAWVALMLLAFAGAMLAYGAIATPARSWDGATSWELRARAFAAAPTLDQPLFRDPAVYGHTREYPVLQPMLLACVARLGAGIDGARAVFPTLWLTLLALCAGTWRRLGATLLLRTGLLVGFGLTPMLVDPTMGGVDSGFADVFALLALTAAAAGLVTRDHWLTAAAVLLCVVVKPEGLLHAMIVVVIAWLAGELRILCAALLGAIAGALLWLPLYLGLVGQHVDVADLAVRLVAIAVPIVVSGAWVRARRPRYGMRIAVLVTGAGVALAGAYWLTEVLGGLGSRAGVLGVYLDGDMRARARLVELPRILGWLAAYAFAPKYFGFIAPLLVALMLWGRGDRHRGRVLGALLLVGLASLALPFLASPETDLAHHVRSSLDRLMLHWVGVAWLLAGVRWSDHAVAGTGLTR